MNMVCRITLFLAAISPPSIRMVFCQTPASEPADEAEGTKVRLPDGTTVKKIVRIREVLERTEMPGGTRTYTTHKPEVQYQLMRFRSTGIVWLPMDHPFYNEGCLYFCVKEDGDKYRLGRLWAEGSKVFTKDEAKPVITNMFLRSIDLGAVERLCKSSAGSWTAVLGDEQVVSLSVIGIAPSFLSYELTAGQVPKYVADRDWRQAKESFREAVRPLLSSYYDGIYAYLEAHGQVLVGFDGPDSRGGWVKKAGLVSIACILILAAGGLAAWYLRARRGRSVAPA